MNLEQAKAKCLNPECIGHTDNFIIVQTDNGEVIEGHSTEAYAHTCVRWLTEHEVKCGRTTQYHVEPLDKP